MNTHERIFQDAVNDFYAGKYADAEQNFRKFLKREPKHAGALNLLTVTLMSVGRVADAEPHARAAASLKQVSEDTFYNYGIVLKRLSKYEEALGQFDRALALNPAKADFWNNRGTVLNDLRRYEDAIESFDKALSLEAGHAGALSNRAKSLTLLKRYEESLAVYDRALALKPDLAEAWAGRGQALFELFRYEDAVLSCERAMALKPDMPESWLTRGFIHAAQRREREAFADFERAIALKPDLAEAWQGRGYIHFAQFRYEAGLADCDRAVALKPDLAGTWLTRGEILAKLSRHDEAVASFDKALAADPDTNEAEGTRLHSKMLCCNWENFDSERDHLIGEVRRGRNATPAFPFLSIAREPGDLLQCARMQIAARFPASPRPVWQGERYRHDRIRLAYISGDFREHPVAFLAAGMFEHHDKSRFEVTAISCGPDDKSETRRRLIASFDRFIEATSMSDREVAAQIRALEIDLLVDLSGLTSAARLGVQALRCAPLQINYLGYTNTLGASYSDYLVADRTTIPDHHREFYAEKICYLPHSYMANDAKRAISEREFSREELGLPEKGFVFCCFNSSYKFTPETFGAWMRILAGVPGSVLWIRDSNPAVAANLRREAEARGIDAGRLIFAKAVKSLAEHLARQRRADLFLDTLPFNAHTTASDALWAGLPVVTCIGETFPGRVAASLLRAVGLPELVTQNYAEFEALAIGLATDPSRLAEIRQRLARNRLTSPLFDTAGFTKHMEAAYTQMHERQQAGLAPDHLYIQP